MACNNSFSGIPLQPMPRLPPPGTGLVLAFRRDGHRWELPPHPFLPRRVIIRPATLPADEMQQSTLFLFSIFSVF